MAMQFAVIGSVLVGVLCSSAYAQPSPTAPSVEAPGPSPTQDRSTLERLTLDARNAARDGRCGAVAVIGARVRRLDPAYYQDVFVVDPTIANCRPGIALRLPSGEPVEVKPPPVAQPVEVAPLPSEIVEVKSPGKALALSLGITAGGLGLVAFGASLGGGSEKDGDRFAIIGAVAFLVGPTMGHVYAGNTWNTGLQWRLASLGLSIGGSVYAVSQGALCGECFEGKRNGADVGAVVALGGMLSFLGATVYEVATAPSSARAYNREYTRSQMRTSVQIVPSSGRAPGFSLVGTF